MNTRFRGLVAVVAAAAAFTVLTPSAGASISHSSPPDCYRQTLLLGSSCTVVHECPETAFFCQVEDARLNVVANKLTGIVSGELHLALFDAEDDLLFQGSLGTCGWPAAIVRQCEVLNTVFGVGFGPGESVHVACNANRKLSLGILTMELFCRTGDLVVINPPE